MNLAGKAFQYGRHQGMEQRLKHQMLIECTIKSAGCGFDMMVERTNDTTSNFKTLSNLLCLFSCVTLPVCVVLSWSSCLDWLAVSLSNADLGRTALFTFLVIVSHFIMSLLGSALQGSCSCRFVDQSTVLRLDASKRHMFNDDLRVASNLSRVIQV